LIGLLCGLVVALAVGIVFAVRGPSAKAAAAESAAPPPPAPAVPPIAVAPAVRPAEPPPVAAPPAGTAATVESEPKLDTIELEVERPPTPTVTGNLGAPARQSHPQPSRQITSPTKKTQPATPPAISRPPPVVAPPAPAEEPATSCNPPYYYEGQKKIFKPSCI